MRSQPDQRRCNRVAATSPSRRLDRRSALPRNRKPLHRKRSRCRLNDQLPGDHRKALDWQSSSTQVRVPRNSESRHPPAAESSAVPAAESFSEERAETPPLPHTPGPRFPDSASQPAPPITIAASEAYDEDNDVILMPHSNVFASSSRAVTLPQTPDLWASTTAAFQERSSIFMQCSVVVSQPVIVVSQRAVVSQSARAIHRSRRENFEFVHSYSYSCITRILESLDVFIAAFLLLRRCRCEFDSLHFRQRPR